MRRRTRAGVAYAMCTVRNGCLNYGKLSYDLPPGAPLHAAKLA
jgi:hypothetical protein